VRRGSVIFSIGRDDSTKPRPALVLQADAFTAYHPVITVAPITSAVTQDALYRIPIPSDDGNGLRRDGEVEIDLIQAIRRQRVAQVIGHASDEVMFNVDQALRRWLAL